MCGLSTLWFSLCFLCFFASQGPRLEQKENVQRRANAGRTDSGKKKRGPEEILSNTTRCACGPSPSGTPLSNASAVTDSQDESRPPSPFSFLSCFRSWGRGRARPSVSVMNMKLRTWHVSEGRPTGKRAARQRQNRWGGQKTSQKKGSENKKHNDTLSLLCPHSDQKGQQAETA